MQRTRTDGKRIAKVMTPILVLLIIAADQISKCYFHIQGEGYTVPVIKDFFSLSTVFNTGAAFSFLNDKPWAQTFFIVLTVVAVLLLYIYYLAVMDKYSFVQYGLAFLFAGILGNFIDRLAFKKVVDFLSFTFGNYSFPTFNVADVAITIGVIILVVHFLFLDKDALFRSRKKKKDE